MIGCPVAAACLDACWLGELSQQPICPHSAHRRRCSHQPLGEARHSTHPSPLGFEAGLIPRLSFFISDFPFVSPLRKIMSRHQQDLPDTALLCHCLSLGRFTEWQSQANRDCQLAISHRFGHELERFPVECTSGPPYWRTTTALIFHLRVLTVLEGGALPDLDNITVRIADVAANLAVLGYRLRDELS